MCLHTLCTLQNSKDIIPLNAVSKNDQLGLVGNVKMVDYGVSEPLSCVFFVSTRRT